MPNEILSNGIKMHYNEFLVRIVLTAIRCLKWDSLKQFEKENRRMARETCTMDRGVYLDKGPKNTSNHFVS